MLSGIRKVVEGVTDMVEPLNPLVTNMDNKNKEIASHLLEAGYSVREVQDFVDVSRTQLDEYIKIEAEVISRMSRKKPKQNDAAPGKAFKTQNQN